MKKTLIAALGLCTALAFAAPVGSAFATTPAAAPATTAATAATKPMKKAVHHASCKPTKTHKCPAVHHTSTKKKKPTT